MEKISWELVAFKAFNELPSVVQTELEKQLIRLLMKTGPEAYYGRPRQTNTIETFGHALFPNHKLNLRWQTTYTEIMGTSHLRVVTLTLLSKEEFDQSVLHYRKNVDVFRLPPFQVN